MSLFATSPFFNFGKKGEFNNSKILSDWVAELKDTLTSVYGLLSDKSTRKPLLRQLLFGSEKLRNTVIPEVLDATEVSENLTALKQSEKSLADFMKDQSIDATSAMGQAFLKASEDVDIMNLSVDKLMETNKKYVKDQTRISKSFSAQGLFGLGKTALKTLGGVALNIGAGLAIEAGISTAATAIYNWVHAADIAIEKGNEARKTISEVYSAMNERKTSINQLATEATGETYETSAESVEALAKKYAELREGVNSRTNENVSLSTENYELYLSISNQLADILPGLVSGLDSQGNKMLSIGTNAASAAEEIKKLLEEQRALDHYTVSQNLDEDLKGIKTEVDQLEKDLKIASDKKKEIEKVIQGIDTPENLVDADRIISIPSELAKAAPKLESELAKIFADYGISVMDILNRDDEGGYSFYTGMFDEAGIQRITEAVHAFTGQARDSLAASAYELGVEISSYESQISSKWNSALNSISTVLSSDATFSKLPEDFQKGFLSSLKSLNLGEAMEARGFDSIDYVYSTFIEPLENITPIAQMKLAALFDLDPSTLNLQEYNRIVLEALQEAFGDNYSDFYKMFGFDEVFKEAGQKVVELKKKFPDFTKEIDSFTGEDLEAAYNLIVEDESIDSFDKLIQKIEELKKASGSLTEKPISFSSLFTTEDGEATDFSKKIDDFQDKISSLQSTMDSLRNGEKVNLTDLFQEFPELIGQTEDLSNAITSLQEKTYGDAIAAIFSQAKDLDSSQMPLVEEFVQSMLLSADLSNVDFGNIKNQIITSLMPTAEDAIGRRVVTDSINAWFANVEMPDLHDIIQNDTLKANVDTYTETMTTLTEAREKFNDGTFNDTDVKNLIEAFPELSQETDNLDEAIDSLMQTADSGLLTMFDNLASKLQAAGREADATALLNYANAVMGAAKQIESASVIIGGATFETPQIAEYEEALESPNEGKTYEDLKSVYEKTKELYEQGLVGTDEFKAGAALFSPTGATDAANFAENMAKAERYFTDDKTGVQNFLDDLESKGYASLETMSDGTKQWTYDIDNLKDAASDMGMSFEGFMSMFGRLSDYGFANDFVTSTEEGISHLGDLYGQLADKEAKLAELKETDPGNTTAIQALEDEINVLLGRIDVTKESLTDLLTIGAEDAETQVKAGKAAIDAMQEQLHNLNPADENYESVKSLIEDQIAAIAQKYHIELEPEITEPEGATVEPVEAPYIFKPDTTESDAARQEASQPVEQPVVQTIEEAAKTQAFPTIGITATIDQAKSQAEEAKEFADQQEGSITIGGDNSPAKSKADEAKRYADSLTGTIQVNADVTGINNSISLALAQPRSINVRANVTGLPGSGASASGTAYSRGTALWNTYRSSIGAYAKGSDWTLPQNENALVNEVGTESIVRQGHWFPIPGGAHFEALKKGDIIFSAEQTKELIRSGRVTSGGGHGRVAHADGTAYNMINAYSNGAGGGGGGFQGGAAPNNNTNSDKTAQNISNAGKDLEKSTKNAAKTAKDFFDWIQVKLDRIQWKIDKNTAQSENKVDYSAKNEKLTKAQNQTRKLIRANEAGEKKYRKHANKVAKDDKLSAKLKKKVRKGTIDIQSLDEDTRQKVENYKQWYDLSKDCKLATIELKQELRDLAQTKLDNIEAEFDGLLSHIEHTSNMIDEYINQAETKGYMVSAKYYDALIKQEQTTIAEREKERDAMIKSFNESVARGDIKEGSVEWHNMKNQIEGVSEEILKSKSNIIEFEDQIRQLKWDKFDRIQEAIGRVVDEGDFLIDLMSNDKLFDEKGMSTAQGDATMGLHGMNYNVYMEQADKYREEMKQINAQLANDPNNFKLLDRKEELLNLQRESILAAEDEKQAMIDLVEEGISKQLEYLDKVIDKYKEALDSQKDLYDYQKNVSGKADEVSSLQKQLEAYAGDTSEESKATIQKLKESLKEAQEALKETEYDKYISDQKELLDDLREEYENVLREKLDNTDQLIKDLIASTNDNASKIKETLETETQAVGTTLTTEMAHIWGDSGKIMSTYSAMSTTMSNIHTVITGIATTVSDMAKGSDKTSTEQIDQILSGQGDNKGGGQNNLEPTTPSGNNNNNGNKGDKIKQIIQSGSSNKNQIKKEKKQNHSNLWNYIVNKYGHIPTYAIYNKLAKQLGIKIKGDKATEKEKNKILDMLVMKGYSSGTRNATGDWAWTQENGKPEMIIRASDGAVLTPVNRGAVFNPDATNTLYNFANSPRDFIKNLGINKMFNVSTTGAGTSIESHGNQFIFNLENVTDYKSFMQELKKDPKFETMVQSMTIDRAVGKSHLNKYKGNI